MISLLATGWGQDGSRKPRWGLEASRGRQYSSSAKDRAVKEETGSEIRNRAWGSLDRFDGGV